MSLTIFQWILLITIIDGLLAFSGAVLFLIFKKNLNKIILFLVSFATGTLLGGAIFHFIPESLKNLSLLKTALILSVGIIVFYLIEKFLHWHHCHKEKCKIHPAGFLILYGDAIHNFVDGIIITSSFFISINIGIITSILILFHEFPQEISNFSILIYGGFSKQKALIYNFLSQSTAIFGAVFAFLFFSQTEKLVIYLLPFAAGGFLYIAIMDLIPEILKEKNKIKIIMNLMAIILGLFLLISAKIFAG